MRIDFEGKEEGLKIGDMFQTCYGDTFFIVYNGYSGGKPIDVIFMDDHLVDNSFTKIEDVATHYNEDIVKIIKNKDILITDNTLK